MREGDEEAITEDSNPDEDRALRRARPAVDPARMQRSLASAERALFGVAEPARMGRFVLLGAIAGGGMGVVHSAYDPQLDRRVALKLLHRSQHGDGRARDRLIAEARALARLDHPNVVPVHDVLVIDDQVVIVMELVEGQTVSEWERAAPRTWREILAIYLQAGRGLAAAHALGIVHRDFKPSNAIVGADGRVRVLDFGLARFAWSDAVVPDAPTVPGGGPHSITSRATLTATGEIVGTVAFMAPEQLEAGPATPATDQFSFCVALHRALYDTAPFSGDDAASLLVSIRSARVAPPTHRRNPQWLRAAIRRGLAADPADRHRSMDALLAELSRERGWRRWRTAIAVGATTTAAATVTAVFALRAAGAAPPDCAIDERIAAVWSVAPRREVETAIERIGTPLARSSGARAIENLDAYAAEWERVRHQTCAGDRMRLGADDLAARKDECLTRLLGELDAAVHTLTRANAATAIADVVAYLPPLAECTDDDLLRADRPPPPPSADRAVNQDLKRRIRDARALDLWVDSAGALRVANAILADARALGYPPTIAEAALLRGRILLSRDEFASALEPLTTAATPVFGDLTPAVVEAEARRLFVAARLGADLDGFVHEAEVILRHAGAMRRGHDAQFARALLLNNVGVLHMARGDRALAGRYFRDAQDVADRIASPPLELNAIALNLALVATDARLRAELAAGAHARYRDALGADHVVTLQALTMQSRFTSDPKKALPLIARVCDSYRTNHPGLADLLTDCLDRRAFLEVAVDDHARAADTYAELAARTATATDDHRVTEGSLALGFERLYRGDPRTALAHFDAAAARLAGAVHWWERVPLATATLGAGLAARDLGRVRVATERLRLAEATYAEILTVSPADVEVQRRLDLTRHALAALPPP